MLYVATGEIWMIFIDAEIKFEDITIIKYLSVLFVLIIVIALVHFALIIAFSRLALLKEAIKPFIENIKNTDTRKKYFNKLNAKIFERNKIQGLYTLIYYLLALIGALLTPYILLKIFSFQYVLFVIIIVILFLNKMGRVMNYPTFFEIFYRFFFLITYTFSVSFVIGIFICNSLGKNMIVRSEFQKPFVEFDASRKISAKFNNCIDSTNMILKSYNNNKEELSYLILDKPIIKMDTSNLHLLVLEKIESKICTLRHNIESSIQNDTSEIIYYSKSIPFHDKETLKIIFIKDKAKIQHLGYLAFDILEMANLPVEQIDNNKFQIIERKRILINPLFFSKKPIELNITIYPRFLLVGCLFSVFVGLFLQMIAEEKSFAEVS